MKKLFLIAGVALSLSATAQTEKGSWMVGGTFSNLNVGFQNSTTNFSLNVNPIGLWFVADNVGIGGQARLGIISGTGSSTFTFGIAPTIRYYFSQMGSSRIFGEAAVDFGGNSSSGKTETATGLALGVGYNYWFNQHVALELGLRYANKQVYNAPGTGFENNLNVNFGLSVFFPKKSTSSVKSSYRKK